jgi:hypothetical protein
MERSGDEGTWPRFLMNLPASYLDIPLPKALVALTLLLPAVALFGWAIARRLFKERNTALVVSFGISVSAWMLFTHVFGLLTHSLSVGLSLSSVGLAAVGTGLWLRDRERSDFAGRPFPGEATEMLIFAATLTVPIIVIAWRWSFHDEIGPGGHQAMVANLQNGYYPPRSLSFPKLDLMYHYGFDLLSAMLTALFRLSVTHAIDVATSALWFYSILASWLLGERMIGRRSGAIVALVLLIGGGVPLMCSTSMAQNVPFASHVLAFCEVGGVLLNPPMASYFFQHPWTLGLPIALTVLLIENEDSTGHVKLRLGALAMLFSALYMSQISMFLSLLGAVCASQLLSRNQQSLRLRFVTIFVLLLSAFFDIAELRGFFAGNAANSSALDLHFGIADTPATSVEWIVRTFGPLLFGLLGFIWLKRRRILYLSLALGGLAVINSVRYRFSWDIVKFATVAAIGLTLPFCAFIRRLQESRYRATQRWLSISLLIVTLAPGVVLLGTLALGLPGIPWMYSQEQPQMTDDARAAASFLRRHMPHDTVMYRRYDDFLSYTIYAGLPQVWINQNFGTDGKLGPERNRLLETLPPAPAPYREQGIRFFVLDAADTRVNPIVDLWLAHGDAALRGTFGALRVVELLPQPSRA